MQTKTESLQQAIATSCREWQQDDNDKHSGSAMFVFPAAFPAFSGHFPDMPVLPAIIQLAAVRYTAELFLGTRLIPVETEKTKFKGMIEPDEEVFINLTLSRDNTIWRTVFSLKRKTQKVIASGSCTFKEEVGHGLCQTVF